jgi:Tat protein translocase TatB subunit
VFLLILDSLGSTELLFILVIALIFFGPRKLPKISRSLGKSIADFRRASEDFKRTWEREVALEAEREIDDRSMLSDEDGFRENISDPAIEAIPADGAIARQLDDPNPEGSHVATPEIGGEWPAQEPSRKQDWL